MKQKFLHPKNIDINIIGDIETDNEIILEWGSIRYSLSFDINQECWFFDEDQIPLISIEDYERGYDTIDEAMDIIKQRICENFNETYIED